MKQYIYLALALVLILVLLVGCSKLFHFPKPGDPVTNGDSGDGSGTSGGTGGGTSGGTSESSGSGSTDGSGNTKSGDWTKDVLLEDVYTAQGSLKDVAPIEISLALKDAQPVYIDIDEEELAAEEISTYEGGADVEYCLAKVREGSEIPQGTAAYLDRWNRASEERAKQELDESLVRREAYMASSKKDYLFLTSWVSLCVERSDTQIFSAIERIYRYNRECEPDYYELHGVTIDAQSGERLSLNDFFTDVESLRPVLKELIEVEEVNKRPTEDAGELADRIMDAILSCRDDGSFAWVVTPAGIKFKFVYGFQSAHHEKSVFVPFSACEGFLKEQAGAAPYDYLVSIGRYFLAGMGVAVPSVPADGTWYVGHFLGQKDGKLYIYGTDSAHTDTYTTDGTLLATTLGELASPYNTEYYTPFDPNHLEIECFVSLFQELQLNGLARIGEGGIPEQIGLFEMTYNSIPFYNAADCEVEIFDSLEASESHMGTLPANSDLAILRSDGETFIDCMAPEKGIICRLYITGSFEDGWFVNGVPKEEWVGHEGYFEE